MKRRLTTTLVLASMAAMPLATIPATTAHAQSVIAPSQDIVLSIGRGELINVPGNMADVFIADDRVADVQVKSKRQLYLFGKQGGVTTVYASNAAGDIIWSANVRIGSNIDSVDQMLNLAMPQAKIAVNTMGTNTVLLTGTVAAPEDAAEANRLVQAFVGEDTNVISRLRMSTPLQVNLQVRFAEVSRTLVRDFTGSLTTSDFGSGFRAGVGTGGTLGTGTYDPSGPISVGRGVANPTVTLTGANGAPILDPTTGQPITIAGPGIGSTELGATVAAAGRLLGLDLLGSLDLAERNGLAVTLSQPNLTALSGETAEFLAGGEFPIPVSQGLGATSVQYRKFGVSLSYTPTVLANGRISMRVRPEVSELSSQGAVTLNGFEIPALTTRRAETSIELGSGQSFMIAGLMSNSSQNSIDKAPGLGDVPILGNLFRSSSYRKGQTELVIIVTPYLVKPVNASDIKLPTDGFFAPNEAERTLGFRESKGNTDQAPRPMPTAVENGGNAPEISRNQPKAVMPNSRNSKQAAKDAKSAPAPGFSF